MNYFGIHFLILNYLIKRTIQYRLSDYTPKIHDVYLPTKASAIWCIYSTEEQGGVGTATQFYQRPKLLNLKVCFILGGVLAEVRHHHFVELQLLAHRN